MFVWKLKPIHSDWASRPNQNRALSIVSRAGRLKANGIYLLLCRCFEAAVWSLLLILKKCGLILLDGYACVVFKPVEVNLLLRKLLSDLILAQNVALIRKRLLNV